jgi:hypothetical protein
MKFVFFPSAGAIITAIPNSKLGYGDAWSISKPSSMNENKSSHESKAM